jgi:hypothetical protein
MLSKELIVPEDDHLKIWSSVISLEVSRLL